MQTSSKKKKSKEKSKTVYNGHRGVREVQAKIYAEVQETEGEVFQNFRILVSEPKLLKYFVDSKYIGHDKLSDELEKYYAGNGEDIFFREKSEFRNLITVRFEKTTPDAKVNDELKEIQFAVSAPIPSDEGCINCIFWRKKNRVCNFYQKVGMEIRTQCPDFKQK